ncbi:hypothetical protein NM688_g8199 [Phlebia brevispora]|uniref:Uncharacterized protein n=1 Tax=Phlebia brevispora TaxID=194682 RepID=A0ACC1RW19_9APHY|nr:hypothetical protein NM688_g8199 [Phlebia brevispora]
MPAERTDKSLRQTTLLGGLVSSSSVAAGLKRASSKSKSKQNVPGRAYTDTILTIKPEFAGLIAKREKNHEFRKYELRETVKRLWLYETAPTSAITYVMETSRPKVPGQVKDPSGIGNDDFDKGLKKSKFGYPVVALYKLKTPLKPEEMKERFGIAPLQGYCYAPTKLVEEVKLEDMIKVF